MASWIHLQNQDLRRIHAWDLAARFHANLLASVRTVYDSPVTVPASPPPRPSTPAPPAVRTLGLGRKYSRKKAEPLLALDDVALEILPGEIFGLLGPNGAGKTTLIKILATLLLPSSGEAWVDGVDVAREPEEVRRRIALVSGGEHSGYGILNVRENIWLFSQLYGIPNRVARERTETLLARLGMADEAKTKVNRLSTGMRQKMNIVRGFVCDPKIIFLDEPTLGLDVQVSRDVRSLVQEWVAGLAGRTVLLTTHYMAEADELSDRVAIIDKGRVRACDTPAALKRALRQDTVFHLEVAGLSRLDGLAELPGVRSAAVIGRNEGDGVARLACALADEGAIAPMIGALSARGARLVRLEKSEPTLEDVFVSLCGHGLADSQGTGPNP
ncbi:MAG: ABC transporter ATP-binding protein [Planctomycetes bacterium]|nr:ABC transporter ATP-binding protein [Planctomycetota bacterium]